MNERMTKAGAVLGGLALLGFLATRDCSEGGQLSPSQSLEKTTVPKKMTQKTDRGIDDIGETEWTQRTLTQRLKGCMEQDLAIGNDEWTVKCSQEKGFLTQGVVVEEPFQTDVLKCSSHDQTGQTMQTTQAYLGPLTVEGETFLTSYVGHALSIGNKGPWTYEPEVELEHADDLEALAERLDQTCESARKVLEKPNPKLAEYQFLNEVLRDYLLDEGAEVKEMSVSTMLGFSGEDELATGFITGNVPDEGIQFQCVLTSFQLGEELEENLTCLNGYSFREDQEMALVQAGRTFQIEDILEEPDSVVLPLTINPNLSSDPSDPDYRGPIQELQ